MAPRLGPVPAARRRAPRGALLLCGVLVVGPPASAEAQVTTEVRAVVFQGNETFPDDSLARAIRTRETECRTWVFAPFCLFRANFALRPGLLNERELPRDAARLQIWYQRRGFREASVQGSSSVRPDGAAEVLFTIREGTPVLADSVRFLGVAEGLAPGLLANLPIRQGDRWSTLALDAT